MLRHTGDQRRWNNVAALVGVVCNHPRNVPALTRLCELRSFAMDELADGVLYCEQALAIDPLSAETRLHLIGDYLDLDDVAAATEVAREARGNSVVPRVLLQMHARDWAAAGEGAYESVARRIATPTVMAGMLNGSGCTNGSRATRGGPGSPSSKWRE
jgi:hypothetical protein